MTIFWNLFICIECRYHILRPQQCLIYTCCEGVVSNIKLQVNLNFGIIAKIIFATAAS